MREAAVANRISFCGAHLRPARSRAQTVDLSSPSSAQFAIPVSVSISHHEPAVASRTPRASIAVSRVAKLRVLGWLVPIQFPFEGVSLRFGREG